MTAKTPIPQNIRRIRTSKGLAQEHVAHEAGISRNAYRSIETGESEPRVSSLQGIARALGVALPELLAQPPQLSSVRFRSSKPRSRKVEATRGQVVVEMAQWLDDFKALENSLGKNKPYSLASIAERLPDADDPKRPVEMARLARKALNLRPDEPIRDVRGLLESAGIKVLAMVWNIEDLFGISVAAADGGPAIAVNVRDDISVERRIFTAAHELGHILLHPGAYDVTKVAEDDEEENQANLFASHFLMPDRLFRSEWQDTYGLGFVDRVLHIKRVFRVSYQTVLYRLAESQQADASKIWMVFKAQWKRRSGQALTKKVEPMALADVDFLEDRLSSLVREGLEAEKITLSRGAEILRLGLNTMREVVASWEVAA